MNQKILKNKTNKQKQKEQTKKSKISVDSNVTFIMHYVHWHCSIDYCVIKSIRAILCYVGDTLCENCFYFTDIEENYKKKQNKTKQNKTKQNKIN